MSPTLPAEARDALLDEVYSALLSGWPLARGSTATPSGASPSPKTGSPSGGPPGRNNAPTNAPEPDNGKQAAH